MLGIISIFVLKRLFSKGILSSELKCETVHSFNIIEKLIWIGVFCGNSIELG